MECLSSSTELVVRYPNTSITANGRYSQQGECADKKDGDAISEDQWMCLTVGDMGWWKKDVGRLLFLFD